MFGVALLLLSGGISSATATVTASADAVGETADSTNIITPNTFDGIHSPKGTVTYSGDDTIVSITDDDMLNYYGQQDTQSPFLVLAKSAHKGVTKIVWHGAAKKGNVDLYLSQTTLTLYHSLIAAGNLGNVILQSYFANYPKVAKAAVNAIKHTVQAGHITSGKQFKIRHWTSITTSNQ